MARLSFQCLSSGAGTDCKLLSFGLFVAVAAAGAGGAAGAEAGKEEEEKEEEAEDAGAIIERDENREMVTGGFGASIVGGGEKGGEGGSTSLQSKLSSLSLLVSTSSSTAGFVRLWRRSFCSFCCCCIILALCSLLVGATLTASRTGSSTVRRDSRKGITLAMSLQKVKSYI